MSASAGGEAYASCCGLHAWQIRRRPAHLLDDARGRLSVHGDHQQLAEMWPRVGAKQFSQACLLLPALLLRRGYEHEMELHRGLQDRRLAWGMVVARQHSSL